MRYLIRPAKFPAKLSAARLLLGLLLIGGIGLLACVPAATSVPQPSPTPSPMPTPGLLERPAPIESAGIEVSADGPPAADLVVVSGLPNACYTFGHHRLTREGDTFRVEIVNSIPDDPMLACAEIYGMITTRIPLEGGVETCGFYDVVINENPYTLQAIAPNARCMGPSTGPGPGTGSGQWAEDSVALAFGRKAPFPDAQPEVFRH